MKETAVPVSTVSNETAIAYCMAGLLALGVGWFAAGILCGLVAVYLGRKAVEHGARTFGRLVQWGGWAELILTIIGLALMPMG